MDEQRVLANARKIAAKLREDVLSLRNRLFDELNPFSDPLSDGELLSSRSVLVKLRYSDDIGRIQTCVDELNNTLQSEGFEYDLQPLEDGQFWSIGTLDLRLNHRQIYNGFLEPVRRETIVRPVPERVVAYLIKIYKDDDLLDREHHDAIGWHYHYLNWKKERSDVILAWDTRTQLDTKSEGDNRWPVVKKHRPIFSEKHAVVGKQFAARPAGWGLEKRSSIHAACKPDLDKWPLSTFRQPSNDASAVWPTDAMLTPRDVELSSASAKSRSKNRDKGHRR